MGNNEQGMPSRDTGLLREEHTRGDDRPDTGVICVFKRGGMCKVHDILGTKHVVSKKTREKNKFGIFVWKISKKTVYECKEGKKTTSKDNQIVPSELNSMVSEDTALRVGHTQNTGCSDWISGEVKTGGQAPFEVKVTGLEDYKEGMD